MSHSAQISALFSTLYTEKKKHLKLSTYTTRAQNTFPLYIYSFALILVLCLLPIAPTFIQRTQLSSSERITWSYRRHNIKIWVNEKIKRGNVFRALVVCVDKCRLFQCRLLLVTRNKSILSRAILFCIKTTNESNITADPSMLSKLFFDNITWNLIEFQYGCRNLKALKIHDNAKNRS